jgi:hypothetical protein
MTDSQMWTIIGANAAVVTLAVLLMLSKFADLNKRIDDLSLALNKRMDELTVALNKRMDELGASVHKRIDDLSVSLHKRIDDLNRRVDDLRPVMEKRP